jgi:hypothetical protein
VRHTLGPAASVLLLGCASAATVAPGADGSTAGNVTVRVGLGPLVPPAYRGGVRVRATDGARVVDVVTDPAGVARLTLDASARWDLTAAEPGYAAVSLLGARPGLSTEVLLRATRGQVPPEVRDVTVRGIIRGRSAPRAAVLLDGARGTTVSRDEAFTVTVPTWPGAPPWQLVALELDASSALLNGWISAPATPDAASSLVVQLPAPARPPTLQELRVEFPVLGRVTPPLFDRVLSEVVARVKYTAAGAQLVPVGRSQLGRPGATSFARWGVEAWDGVLAPELISASFRVAGAAALHATVTTRPSFRGVVPAFAVVTTLASTAGPAGAATLDVAAGGWSRAAFTVTVGDVVAWEGYGVDDLTWESRPLPPLPDGVTRASLAAAPGPVVLRACVLRDLPLSSTPWSSPAPALQLRNLLTVCEEQGAALGAP